MDGIQVDATVSYENSNIETQKLVFNFENKEGYIDEISYAKTSYPFKISSDSDIKLLPFNKNFITIYNTVKID